MRTCPNCGKTLAEDETICTNCGVNTVEPSTETTQLESFEKNEPATYKPKRFVSKINYGPKIFKDDDDEFYLLDVYISRNIDKMKNGFSWPSFFFSTLYFFYRKMWLLGIITIIIYSVLGYIITNPVVALLVGAIYNIVVASIFKDLYLKRALSTIDRIKAENPNKKDEELAEIVKNKGGTSTIVLILIFIGLIVTFIVNGVLIISAIQKAGGDAGEYFKNVFSKGKDSANKIDDMLRENKETNVTGNLYIIFPSGYKQVDNDGDTFVFNNSQSCKVTVQTTEAFAFANSTDTYMDIKIKSSTVNQDIEYKNANYHGHQWRYATIDSPNKTMVFTTIYGSTLYDVTIMAENDSTTCMLNAEKIALTFKFK